MAAALLLAACSQNELADGNTLPDGKYPLQLGSVSLSVEVDEQPWGASHAPQTRVSENPDGNSSHWEWNGSEQIGVQLYADGDVATYTLNSGKTLTSDKTLYWKNTQPATVSAWYPIDKTVSLADQSKGLKYVLKGSGTGNYQSDVNLNFTHSLAKVRVIPSDSDAGKVTEVKVWSHISCTHTNGTDIQGNNEGWLTMKSYTYNGEKRWEANVVPGYTIEKMQVNGKEITLSTTVKTVAAKAHKVTIDVQPAGPTEITGGETITEGELL